MNGNSRGVCIGLIRRFILLINLFNLCWFDGSWFIILQKVQAQVNDDAHEQYRDNSNTDKEFRIAGFLGLFGHWLSPESCWGHTHSSRSAALDNLYGNIVQTTGFVGQVNQLLATLAGCFLALAEHSLNGKVGNHSAQAVGAKHQCAACIDGDGFLTNDGRCHFFNAEGVEDFVLTRMALCFFGCDFAIVNERLHVTLVFAQLLEPLIGGVVIDAAVANPSIVNQVVLDNGYHTGGAHSAQFGAGGCTVQDALVGCVASLDDGFLRC